MGMEEEINDLIARMYDTGGGWEFQEDGDDGVVFRSLGEPGEGKSFGSWDEVAEFVKEAVR